MPDPGLTDLIAAHRLKQSYWNWWGCTGCDWRTKGTYGSEPTIETATEHAKHVVEQHTNGRIQPVLEDFDWHIQNASNGAVCAAEADDGQALMSYQAEMGIYKRAAQLLRAALEGEQQ